MGRLLARKKSIYLLSMIILFQIIIHAPHVGKGFIKDDFIWLEHAIGNGEIHYLKPFTHTTGFFRPMVSLSFALQYSLFKLNSKPYGLFNLCLHLINIVLVYLIFSRLQYYKSYALLVSILFAVNAKGTAFAVGWISARTTLLFTFFMLISTWLLLRFGDQYHKLGWTVKTTSLYVFTTLFYLAALLSKENAVIAPFYFFLFITFSPKVQLEGFLSWQKIRNALLSISAFIFPLMIYFFLRLKSNAFSPMSAPEYYQYSLSPGLLLKNLTEYIIRAGLFDFYVIACLIIMIWIVRKSLPSLASDQYKVSLTGLLWFLTFLLPTIAIASRSDLYIYFPQIGIHLLSAVIIIHLWKAIEFSEQTKRTQFLLILPLALLVLGWIAYLDIKSSNYGSEGCFSHQFSSQVIPAVASLEKGTRIFVVDLEKDKKKSLSNIISYGFEALLKMYNPYKDFSGRILDVGEMGKGNYSDGKVVIGFWSGDQLKGLYDGSTIRCWALALNPFAIGYNNNQSKDEPIPNKRLYRLKKRKMRLKKNKMK